jgi:hypothetical protein
MAQVANSTVDNGTGAAVRSDINARFAALFSNHSGTTDGGMSTKTLYQFWADTSSNKALKILNNSNEWKSLRGLEDGAVLGDTELKFRVDGTQRLSIGKNVDTIQANTGGPSILVKTDRNPFVSSDSSHEGMQITQDGRLNIGMTAKFCMGLNRIQTDGNFINFSHAGAQEGSINVSGTTVGFNGGHLSRWSQLPGNSDRIEIKRGTVLSNLDEMCEWGSEDNEQLNRMSVSTVEGDVNVAGVFQCWDDDDDVYTNDFYCAMTGDFIIRVSQGVTVARGDLLMSAGDGTAKPQGDDIVRSKTIAKVTSTVVSATYADGSYCVPCVLMAC